MAGEAQREVQRLPDDPRLEARACDVGNNRAREVADDEWALDALGGAAVVAARLHAAQAMQESADAALTGDSGEAPGPPPPGAAPPAEERRAALRRDLRAALRALGVPDDVAPAAALCGRPRVVAEALLAALRAPGVGPAGLTSAELAARVGRATASVRAMLHKLCASGEVVACGRGRFGAAPAPGVSRELKAES